MAKRRASLQFRTPYAPGDVVAVYLELQLPDRNAAVIREFSILSGGEPVDLCYFERERQWFVFEVVVGANRRGRNRTDGDGRFQTAETRQLLSGRPASLLLQGRRFRGADTSESRRRFWGS